MYRYPPAKRLRRMDRHENLRDCYSPPAKPTSPVLRHKKKMEPSKLRQEFGYDGQEDEKSEVSIKTPEQLADDDEDTGSSQQAGGARIKQEGEEDGQEEDDEFMARLKATALGTQALGLNSPRYVPTRKQKQVEEFGLSKYDDDDDDLAYNQDRKYLESLDKEFDDLPVKIEVDGFQEVLLKLVKEDGTCGRALIHCQQTQKALVHAHYLYLSSLEKNQDPIKQKRLLHWHERKQEFYDRWDIALGSLLTHCAWRNLNFPEYRVSKGITSTLIGDLTKAIDEFISEHEYFSEVRVKPTALDFERYHGNRELEQIIHNTKYYQREPISDPDPTMSDFKKMFPGLQDQKSSGSSEDPEMTRSLAPAFTEDRPITVFLEAKNMAPLGLDARASTTVADLCHYFRKHRYINQKTKIDVVWNAKELSDMICVAQFDLQKGDKIEMKVHWDD